MMLKEMVVEKSRKYSMIIIPFVVFIFSVIAAVAANGRLTAPVLCAVTASLSPLNAAASAAGGIMAYLFLGEAGKNGFIICSVLLITAGKFIMRGDKSPKISVFICFISMAFSGIVFGLVVTGTVFQAVVNIVYAVFISAVTYFTENTMEIFKYSKQFSADKNTLINIAVFYTAVVSLSVGVNISFINAGIVFAAFAVLCSCRFFGSIGGAVCGILSTVGIFIGFDDMGIHTAFFGAAGLMAGLLSGYSRITVTASFSAVILLGQLATGLNDNAFFVQADAVMASVLFMLVPERFITLGGRYCAAATKDSGKLLCKEMEFAAKSMGDIRKSVFDIMNVFTTKNKSSDTIKLVSDSICGKCKKKLDCWERKFEITNTAFRKIQKGKNEILPLGFTCPKEEIIKEEFDKCKREETFSKILNEKLMENRSFLFSQMEASENIINALSEKINVNVSHSMTATFCRILEKYSVEYNTAIVYYTDEKRMIGEVFISKKAEPDCQKLCDILSRELSVKFDYTLEKSGTDEIRLRFSQKTKYRLEVAQYQLSADIGDPSGDCSGVFYDGLGYAYVYLSDGMGHGSCAAVDSQLTASLFKRLIRLGMTCDSAIKMINSIMLAKSTDESFATLDVAKINLETGGMCLLKSGGASSIIKYGDSVMMYSFPSNPIGIIHNLESNSKKCDFNENNILVMMSDGVPENAYLYIKEQLGFENTLEKISENICNYSRKLTCESISDDITVTVVKMVANN